MVANRIGYSRLLPLLYCIRATATRLQGKDTLFLSFNRGCDRGRASSTVTHYPDDPEFRELLCRVIAQRIYDEVRGVCNDIGMVQAE